MTGDFQELRAKLEAQVRDRTRQLEMAHAALQASEERLRYALEGARDGLWDWELATDKVYYSPRWKQMLGCTEEEVEETLGAWARLVHPDDREPTLRAVEAFRNGRREEFRVEFRMRHKQGHWVEILSRGTLLRDPHGNPVRLIGTHVDITAEKRASERLQRSRDELERQVQERTGALEQAVAELSAAKERMRLQLAETPALLYSGAPGIPPRATFVSANARSLLGFEPEEITRDPGFWLRQVHPEDVAGVERSFAALERHGSNVWEYRFRTRAGRYVWLRDYVRLLRDAQGRPVELLGCAIDISERRETEESLRARETELRTLVENSHDFILRLDRDGRQSYANPAMAGVYGLRPEELIGKRLRDLDLPPSVWQPARAAFERIVRTRSAETIEVTHELGGRLRHFEARCVPEPGPGGHVASVLVVAREVTERKRAEEALREAEMRARALAEAAFEGIIIHSAGTIIEVNTVAARLFGMVPEQMIGTLLLELLDPASRQRCHDPLLAGGNRRCEADGLRLDGTTFPMELQSRDFPYRGHPARVTAVRDLSLGRQAQERIQALQAEEALKREQAQRESFARQLILAQEKERERIAAELHDGLGQNVLVIKHQAERGLAETANVARMRESLTAILGLAGQSVHDIRGIVRHLHPYLLRQLGLTRAVRAMVDTLNQSSPISFTADLQTVDHLLAPESEIAFYRVLQECLNNVVKHSQATAATVGVRHEPGGLTAWVQDDGCGFDLDQLGSGDRVRAGMGLRGITERMHLLGGTSRFVTQPGKGVRVELQLPLTPSSPAEDERSGVASGLQPNHTPTLR